MQQPPDRPAGFPIWTVAILIAAATAGAVWWIVRGGSTPASGTRATHAPCQPMATASPSPGSDSASRTEDWEITVTSARAEPSVPARDGGTYRAAPGEVFIVVAVSFQNLHAGTEAAISTTQARLECSDGTDRSMAGFDDRRGFCRVCAMDLGTNARRVRWTFIFRMEREFLGQSFRFRYASAQPIDLQVSE